MDFVHFFRKTPHAKIIITEQYMIRSHLTKSIEIGLISSIFTFLYIC